MNRGDQLKIGILGYASIARRYIISSLQSHRKFELVAIARRFETGEEPSTLNMVYGYEKLLAEYDLDAVYIALPNSLHVEWAEKALNRDIHVLVEKSLACSLSETKMLVALASAKNLALVENFQFRFHSQLDYILNLISQKKIGEMRAVRCWMGFPTFDSAENIRYEKSLGGGSLLDAGVYTLKLSSILLGDNCDVPFGCVQIDPDRNVDVWGNGIVVERSSKLTSHISFGFDNHYQCGLEVWGSNGIIKTNRIFTAPPTLEPVVQVEDENGVESITLPADNHFHNMLDHFFHQCCIGGSKEESEENLSQAKLTHEFQRSAGLLE